MQCIPEDAGKVEEQSPVFANKEIDRGSSMLAESAKHTFEAHQNPQLTLIESSMITETTSTSSGIATKQIHSGEKPYVFPRYKCQQCHKCLKYLGSLTRHNSVHSGERPYECHKCISTSSDLAVHTRIHSGEKPKPYECQHCGKCFSTSSDLTIHTKCIHSGEKPRPYEFHMRGDLTRHNRVHSGKKPYECKQCGKRFSTSSNLKMHSRRIHSGEKPYECKQCGKRFSASSNLTMHAWRIHSGEKPYECKHCGKCFSTSGDRTKHTKRMHSGEKSYKCQQCGKCFSASSQLAKHEQIHSDKNPYEHLLGSSHLTEEADDCESRIIPDIESGSNKMSYKYLKIMAPEHREMKNHTNQDFIWKVQENIKKEPLSEEESQLQTSEIEVDYSGIIQDVKHELLSEEESQLQTSEIEVDYSGII